VDGVFEARDVDGVEPAGVDRCRQPPQHVEVELEGPTGAAWAQP
jgi:hypothetical protein